MKRFLIMICAVAALVCSCDKYGATLDDLGERIEAQYQDATKLLSKVDAMALLAQAKDAQMKIVSVTYDETSMTVTFADGTKYIIEQGKESGIVATESDEYWTFTFDGESLDLLKEFAIILDAETIELSASSTADVAYALQAGGETSYVTAKGYGVSVLAIDQENNTITIKAGRKPGEASLLITAIRNFDSKVVEKIVPVEIGPRQNEPVVFEGANSGYYAQQYSSAAGTDNFFTQFWKGEVDEDNYFVGEAYSVIIDFYAPAFDEDALIEDIVLPAGTYKVGEDCAVFTFMPGLEMTLREQLEEDLWIYQMFFGFETVEEVAEYLGYSVEDLDLSSFVSGSGSELYHQFADESFEDLAITDGTVVVERNGNAYKVTMNVVADYSNWELTFEGEIPVEDHRPQPDVYDMAQAYCVGDYNDEATEWLIYVLDSETYEDTGNFIQIDLLAPKGSYDSIPDGKYTCSDSEEAFTLIPGEDYTYWYRSGFCWDEASSGTFTVKAQGDGVYTFKGKFHDDYYGEDWSFIVTAPVEGDIAAAPGTPSFRADVVKKPIKPNYTGRKADEAIAAYKAHKAGREIPSSFVKTK